MLRCTVYFICMKGGFFKNYKYIKDESAGLITIRDPMVFVFRSTYYLTGTQPPYWRAKTPG